MTATITAPELGLIDCTNAEHHAIRALSNSGMRARNGHVAEEFRTLLNVISPDVDPEEQYIEPCMYHQRVNCGQCDYDYAQGEIDAEDRIR